MPVHQVMTRTARSVSMSGRRILRNLEGPTVIGRVKSCLLTSAVLEEDVANERAKLDLAEPTASL